MLDLSDKICEIWHPDGTKTPNVENSNVPEKLCQSLESGGIIYFPQSPFQHSPEDMSFLLTQKLDESDHKNIIYMPAQNRIVGLQNAPDKAAEHLRKIMSEFMTQTQALLQSYLCPYKDGSRADYTSYRPIEEKGRKLPYLSRNELIHVDAFPLRPTKGDRILRIFENINPHSNRVWRTSDTFDVLVQQFENHCPVPPQPDKEKPGPFFPFLNTLLGIKTQSEYDGWMQRFHNFLKENSEFQTNCRKATWEFPPDSAWIVFTDMVSHSVLSGQYALEQTYIVSQDKMLLPEKAPINILRSLAAKRERVASLPKQ